MLHAFTFGLVQDIYIQSTAKLHFRTNTISTQPLVILMKLPTMFIQDLKLIKSSESRPRVWSPQTQSREPGHKSVKEKLMWPYTSKFNPHAKNHSLRADDRVKDTLRSRPSLLSRINHTWAFLIFILYISLLLKILRGKLFFDISLTLTKAAVPCTALQCGEKYC